MLIRWPARTPVVKLQPGTLGPDREALFRSLVAPKEPERTAVPVTMNVVTLPRNTRRRAAKWVE